MHTTRPAGYLQGMAEMEEITALEQFYQHLKEETKEHIAESDAKR
jgi:hypothetical protein